MNKLIITACVLFIMTSFAAGCGRTVDRAASDDNEERENESYTENPESSDIYMFDRVREVRRGELMTTLTAGNDGGIKFVSDDYDILSLPADIENGYSVNGFTIYDNRIYYFVNISGSDVLPSYIYSCDMNGEDQRMVSDSACSYSDAFILDGYIYYDTEGADRYSEWLAGGMWEDRYYSNYDTSTERGIYRVRTDGTDKVLLVRNADIISADKNGIICSEDEFTGAVNAFDLELYDFNGKYLGDYSRMTESEEDYRNWILDTNGYRYFCTDDGIIYRESFDGQTEELAEAEPYSVSDENVNYMVDFYDIAPGKVIFGNYISADEGCAMQLKELIAE